MENKTDQEIQEQRAKIGRKMRVIDMTANSMIMARRDLVEAPQNEVRDAKSLTPKLENN